MFVQGDETVKVLNIYVVICNFLVTDLLYCYFAGELWWCFVCGGVLPAVVYCLRCCVVCGSVLPVNCSVVCSSVLLVDCGVLLPVVCCLR